MNTIEQKFQIGDRVSYYDSYFGRRTGVIAECLGVVSNADGPRKDNICYRFTDNVTGNMFAVSQKKVKMCKKVNEHN